MLLNLYLISVAVIGVTMIAGGLWECFPKRKPRSSRDASGVLPSAWLIE